MDEKGWLSLAEASELLGVHPSTLRRWADSGSIPCLKTPGRHRRFQRAVVDAWLRGRQATTLGSRSEILLQGAVRFTQQEMARKHVSDQSWYLAFGRDEDRQMMRDAGRRLLGLAIQYMSRTFDHGPALEEGRQMGNFYGQECAEHGVSLVDTVRALFFFRDSLLGAIAVGQSGVGWYDSEDLRIHRRLGHFLDEVVYASLGSYEETCARRVPVQGLS